MSEPIDHRKVYAKGYYDGLNAAGIERNNFKGGEVDSIAFKSIHNGLSSIGKKAYQAIPIGEQWTIKEICQEMFRQTKAQPDGKIVANAVRGMVESKIVEEHTMGKFCRAVIKQKVEKPVREKQSQSQIQEIPVEVSNVAVVNNREPLDKLASISVAVRSIADSLKKLADDLETVAIDVDERFNSENADTTKLRQLQQILNSLR